MSLAGIFCMFSEFKCIKCYALAKLKNNKVQNMKTFRYSSINRLVNENIRTSSVRNIRCSGPKGTCSKLASLKFVRSGHRPFLMFAKKFHLSRHYYSRLFKNEK